MASASGENKTYYDRQKPGFVGRKVRHALPLATETVSISLMFGGAVAVLAGYPTAGKVVIGAGFIGFLLANGLV